jgi:L-lactate utilization protein LutB
MSRYKSNYSYAQDLRDVRQHGMEIARKLAAEQALVIDLNNQIHELRAEAERYRTSSIWRMRHYVEHLSRNEINA